MFRPLHLFVLLLWLNFHPTSSGEFSVQVQGTLAAECSLIVLDALELLVQVSPEISNSVVSSVFLLSRSSVSESLYAGLLTF